MRHDYLDRYSRIDSPIHRLPVWSKLIGLLAILVMLAGTPVGSFAPLTCAMAILILTSLFSAVPITYFLQRMLFLSPFAIAVSAFALVRPDGPVAFGWLVLRVIISLFALVILTSTTPFARILDQLRRWHIPPLLVTVMALLYRYIFVIVDEIERMRRARKGRSFTGSRRKIWEALSVMIGEVFIRSTERSERVFAAMQSRGWQ